MGRTWAGFGQFSFGDSSFRGGHSTTTHCSDNWAESEIRAPHFLEFLNADFGAQSFTSITMTGRPSRDAG